MRDATLNIATGELIEHGIDCPLCDHCATAYDTLTASHAALLAALLRVAGDLNAPGGDSISANTEAAVRAAIAACEVQS